LDEEIKGLRAQLKEAQNRNDNLEAESKRIAKNGETAAKAAQEEKERVASLAKELKGELGKVAAAHVQVTLDL
jgi:hypothetical protein